MAELTASYITPIAEEKILELAYKASKYINLSRASDEIYQGGVMCHLLDVLNDSNTLLDYADKQQIIQGIIGIGNLKV